MFPEGKRRETDEGVDIRRIGLKGSKNLYFVYTLGQFYANYYIQKVDPDVVLGIHSPLPWFLLTSRPCVSLYHHINGKEFFDTHDFPLNYGLYAAETLGVLKDRDSTVLTVSDSVKQDLVDNGHNPDNIDIIKNGVEVEKFRFNRSSSGKVVYLGRLDRRKGAQHLPSIFESIKSSESFESLEIAGDGPKRGIAEDLAENEQRVNYHGFVSEEDKIELLSEADVAVVPSLTEGYGIVVLEANSSGTPVVANDTEGLRDSVKDGETGFLRDVKNPKEFGEAVRRLLQDDELRHEMADKARAFAEEHSWDSSAAKLERILKEKLEE
jgi:glycosyltransferase involved in cell wall biosynthesis